MITKWQISVAFNSTKFQIWRSQFTGLREEVKMNAKLLIPACLLVIFAMIPSGSSIQCHQCSSYTDVHCDDPFYYEDNKGVAKTTEYLKDCPNDGKDYFCRKIFQNVRGDTRVIRSCGWEKHEKGDCYSTVCDTDGCNSGSMFSLSSLAVFSTLLVAFIMQ